MGISSESTVESTVTYLGRKRSIPWNMSMRSIMQLSEKEAENKERDNTKWRGVFPPRVAEIGFPLCVAAVGSISSSKSTSR